MKSALGGQNLAVEADSWRYSHLLEVSWVLTRPATRFAMRMSGLPKPLASGTTPTMTKPHF